MKVSVKQLAKMLMEEKTVLATHHGGEEGTEGYEKDVLSRSWGDDEEADPKLDFVDEARFAELAGIQEQAGGKHSSHPDVDALAAAVQTIVDSGSSAIMDMATKLQGMGYDNADYISGAGMRLVQIPMGPGAQLVVISKNSVEPDSETAIVGPYAVGLMT